MRISDWSSDVCSSDLAHVDDAANRAVEAQRPQVVDEGRDVLVPLQRADEEAVGLGLRHEPDADSGHDAEAGLHEESVPRRAEAVGKEEAAERHGDVAEAGPTNAALGHNTTEATHKK